jgi:hypothetical protein
VGAVGENVRKDGDFVRASLVFYDPLAIQQLERGDKQELSCGYTCELLHEPGEWQGQKYDAIQRNIRGNHVALVTQGRAGPEVRVRLDDADALDASLTPSAANAPSGAPNPGGSVVKFKVDGVEYDVSEQAKQALERELGRRDSREEQLSSEAKAAKADAEKAQGRADELQKKLDEAEKLHKDAVSPERMREAVRARVALERQALPVLGAEAKLDAMSDRDVKLAVLKKQGSEVKADASDDYVQGRFEEVLKRLPSPIDRAKAAVLGGNTATTHSDSGDDAVAAARARMVKEAREAWKQKPAN